MPRALVTMMLLACAGGGAGCNTLASVEAGYQQPFESKRAPGHRGFTLDGHMGLGPGDVPVGGEISLRTKQGSHLGQYAFGFGGYAFTPPEVVGAYGRVGINVLQFETRDGEASFGMGSPWAELAVYFNPDSIDGGVVDFGGGLLVTVKGVVGYDVHFTERVPDGATWAVMVGLGFFALSGR